MKYLNKTPILVFVAVLSLTLTTALAQAQNATVDDSTIQSSLEEKGLDKAPEPLTVPDITLSGEKPYSGLKDENGNPLSDEEFAAYREEQSKGALQKYPLVVGGIAILILGTIVAVPLLIVRSSKKKKATNTAPVMTTPQTSPQQTFTQPQPTPTQTSPIPPQQPANDVAATPQPPVQPAAPQPPTEPTDKIQ